jgi:hypothetical protein
MQSVVISGTGHRVAEAAPKEMLEALSAFLAPDHKASARRNAVAADSRVLR